MEAKSIIESLEWRYATKAFDASKKLDKKLVNQIVEAARLTATSYGMQLMKMVVLEDQKIKNELVEYTFDQQQVADASHVLILCRELEADYDHLDQYIDDIAKTRNVAIESLSGFKNMMANSILTKSEEEQIIWMEKQVYIALGNILTVCAMLKVDACPMEGFLPDKYDEVLGLAELGLSPVLVIPIGYRSAEDKYGYIKKVRRESKRFIVKI